MVVIWWQVSGGWLVMVSSLMTSNLRMVCCLLHNHGVNYELFAWEERAGHNYCWDDTMDIRVVFLSTRMRWQGQPGQVS